MPQPVLQHGTSEATIDQVNIAMRAMPWYQQQMQQWGQDPGHPTLSKSQSQQIKNLAQANGIQVDEGDVELDDHGNFNPKGHKLRNTLIVAGIAAATIATMGAAGAFSAAGGLAGGGAGAAGAGGAGAAGLGAGSGITAAGIGTGGLVGSGLSATSLGLGATAGLGTAGAVGAGTLGTAATIGALAPTLAGAAVPTASTLGTASTIAGTTGGAGGAFDAAGNFTGDTTYGVGSGASKGMDYLKTAQDVGSALGDYSQGRADARLAENNAAYGTNRNLIDLYKAQTDAANSQNVFNIGKTNAGVNVGNLDINQKQFSLDAPGKRASNSVRGDILANAKDATVSGISPNTPVPTISGGLRPSMFSDNTRALGGELSKQALASQQAGDTFAPLPTVPDYVQPPAPPPLTQGEQAGSADSWLNTASTIAKLSGYIPYKRAG